jgi:hypothetical protein
MVIHGLLRLCLMTSDVLEVFCNRNYVALFAAFYKVMYFLLYEVNFTWKH